MVEQRQKRGEAAWTSALAAPSAAPLDQFAITQWAPTSASPEPKISLSRGGFIRRN
jgi:hypothetical protein